MKIFRLFGFPSWKSIDTKIIGINTLFSGAFYLAEIFEKVTFLG